MEFGAGYNSARGGGAEAPYRHLRSGVTDRGGFETHRSFRISVPIGNINPFSYAGSLVGIDLNR